MNELLHQLSSKLSPRDRIAARVVQDQYRRLVYYTTLVCVRETPNHFLPNSFMDGSQQSAWVAKQNEFFKMVKVKYNVSVPSDVCAETSIDFDESVLIDCRDELDEDGELNEDEQEDDEEGYDYYK